jgi:thiamine biosynthesis protein ThiS
MANVPAEAIVIQVNGEKRKVPPGMSVAALLSHLGIDPARVAVEMNRAIVRKADWTGAAVEPGAEVEIVHFVGGGSR